MCWPRTVLGWTQSGPAPRRKAHRSKYSCTRPSSAMPPNNPLRIVPQLTRSGFYKMQSLDMPSPASRMPSGRRLPLRGCWSPSSRRQRPVGIFDSCGPREKRRRKLAGPRMPRHTRLCQDASNLLGIPLKGKGKHKKQIRFQALNAVAKQQQSSQAQASRPSQPRRSRPPRAIAAHEWAHSAAQHMSKQAPVSPVEKRPAQHNTGYTPERKSQPQSDHTYLDTTQHPTTRWDHTLSATLQSSSTPMPFHHTWPKALPQHTSGRRGHPTQERVPHSSNAIHRASAWRRQLSLPRTQCQP